MMFSNVLFSLRRQFLFAVEQACPSFPIFVALTYQCNKECHYCYAKQLPKHFSSEMSVHNFEKLIKWLRVQKQRKIILTGGEPTQHSHFSDVLALCRQYGMHTSLATNGFFDDYLDHVIAGTCKVVFVNFSTHMTGDEREALKEKLERLRANGLKLIFKVNVSSCNEDLEDIVQFARQISARIRIGFISPALFEERAPELEYFINGMQYLEKWAERAVSLGVYTYLARPVPRCAYSDAQWKRLRKLLLVKSKCFVGFKENYVARMVVNPDLSSYGCFGNRMKIADVTAYASLADINQQYGESFRLRTKQCLLGLSDKCKYLTQGECYGACFSYSKGA